MSSGFSTRFPLFVWTGMRTRSVASVRLQLPLDDVDDAVGYVDEPDE